MTTGVGTLPWADQTGGQLSLQDRLALFAQGVPTQTEELVGWLLSRVRRMKRTDHAVLLRLAGSVGSDKPTTSIERAARDLCWAVSPPWLRAHCCRTYALGALLGRGLSFDSEILFVASMLHDVGLTDAFRQGSDPGLIPAYTQKGAPCFAVRGAGVAQSLASIHGWPSASSNALAEAISLHLNARVTKSRGVEAHLLNAASAFDVVRLKSYRLPFESARRVEERWPRGDSFCRDLLAVWVHESDDHPQCRGAFLNRWGCFKQRVRRACLTKLDASRTSDDE